MRLWAASVTAPKASPWPNKPIEAKTDKALANQVAKRRQAGEPWWKIAAAAGKSEARLKVLLAEHRHPASGNGSEPEPEAS